MSVFQGDFLGFQLGEEHSYRLNITRVSTNDRYQDTLLPAFTDVTVQVPGGDGTYYFDTYYNQKQFTIDFVFDDLRDEDLRSLRQLFSFKSIKPLIFDEFPYKKYMVKCMVPPQLRYICFDEYDVRVYKGEGTVQLIAYYPFGISTNTTTILKKNKCEINNNGDLPTNFKVIFNKTNSEGTDSRRIVLRDLNGVELNELRVKNIVLASGDNYVLIDSYTHLIEGLDASFHKTGNLYNQYITKGDFFTLPVGRTVFAASKAFESFSYNTLYY